MPEGKRFPIYWRICRFCGDRYQTKSRNRTKNKCEECKKKLIIEQEEEYMRFNKKYFRTCHRCGKEMRTPFKAGKICPKCSLVPLSRYITKGDKED